jgi:predicted AlkP superfamily phosphohydrolase/phosphomutase
MNKRVLVVGWDGATFDIIHPLVAAGRLPNIAAVMRDGAQGVLRSCIPPISPSAWTTIFTGKNAGRHGIYGFQELDRDTYQFRTVRTDQHREKTIWDLLGEAGKRSVVIDVPFTYPPRSLNGLTLTGYGTPRMPGTVFTYPEAFAARLPHDLQSEARVALPTHRFDRSQHFIDEWWAVMAGRQKLLKHLITQEAWDFFMVVFSITDNMAHVFWTYVDPAHPNYYRPEGEHYREAFLHGYELCDRLLGELMEAAGPETTTLILSDHGFGSVRPRQYVYNRLLKGNYLSPKSAGGKVPLGRRIVRTAVGTYNRFPVLREWVKGLTPNRRTTLIRSLVRTGIMPTEQSIDFHHSQVIPSNFGLRMWINDNGRFPHGQVPAGEKENVLAELRAFLEADRDQATGRPVIAQTYLGSDLYHGPYAQNGPDLVIEYTNFYTPGREAVAPNPHLEGGHTLEGIFLAHGPPVQNTTITGAGLVDLAPTLLHLLDQPIPPDMDGRVLADIFDPAYVLANPIIAGTIPARREDRPETGSNGYSEAEEAEINEQLRQLGYID